MDEKPYYMKSSLGAFGDYRSNDDHLHPEFYDTAGTELTETQLFGFSVPQAAIHAILYTWHHPNLHTVSGGSIVFQGIKAHAPAAEISDFRYFMHDAAVRSTFPDYILESGYRVEMLETGRRFRTSYRNDRLGNEFDVTHTAIGAPIMWPGDKHFEQIMRTEGHVVLRGQRHPVDGYHVRDRSWGQSRPEGPADAPPLNWVTGVFDDRNAFHLTASDDPRREPLDRCFREEPTAATVKFGWMILDGRRTAIKDASALTKYDRSSLIPTHLEIDILDEHEVTHRLVGTIIAATPVHFWHNVRVPVCLARWEWNGKVGWGDVQNAQHPEFVYRNC